MEENYCALSVWLDIGGRQGLITKVFQLTIYLVMHGIFLALISSNSAPTFKLIGKAESQKYRGKMRCKSVDK